MTSHDTESGVLRRLSQTSIEQKFLAVLVILYLVKGVTIAFVHEPFSGHDEVMHYAYLQYVAEEHRLPIIPDLGIWRAESAAGAEDNYDRAPANLWPYCQFNTPDWNIACESYASPTWKATLGDELLPMGWIYTANHPPLYYLLLTPVYWAIDDLTVESQLYALRLATLPFGLLVVALAWLTVRVLFPRDRFLAMTVPTFVAFQPQISYEAAMLNNDMLAIAFTSTVIYLIVRGLRSGFPVGNVALTGFCFGLAMLSKNTSVMAGAPIAVAMILGLGVRNWREWLAKGALAASIPALMIWPWFAYMQRTYGDFTALGRVRELQWWNYSGGATPTIWSQLTNQSFFWWRWKETWGEFGWRLIPLSDALLRVILCVVVVGTVGIGVWAIRVLRESRRSPPGAQRASVRADAEAAQSVFTPRKWQVAGAMTMGVTCITAYFAVLQFGVTFSLTQARYFFPAILPAAILLMLGFRALIPRRWLGYSQLAIFISLVVLNIVIYSGWVLPYWATAGKHLPQIDPFFR
ncbi:hypothetical protein BH20CHL3_BH20CHL3_09200 [soil metagenome]